MNGVQEKNEILTKKKDFSLAAKQHKCV